MRPARLSPGKLAGLIAALYEASAGSPSSALHQAAASSSLKVLTTTQQVEQQLNPYNISAALLAPEAGISSWSTVCSQNSSSNISSSTQNPLNSRSSSSSSSMPSWSTALIQHSGSSSSSSCSFPSTPPDHSLPCTNHLYTSPGLQQPHLFPVYLIITGINAAGLQPHITTARQLYSQADFFVCAKQGSFWAWAAKKLQHGPAVPDLVQQPLQGFIRPWMQQLHERCMPMLAEQGYEGIEGYQGIEVIMAGHSLGGFLVDCAALLLPRSCAGLPLRFSSVSFESPGVPAAVLQQQQQQQQQGEFVQRSSGSASSSKTDRQACAARTAAAAAQAPASAAAAAGSSMLYHTASATAAVSEHQHLSTGRATCSAVGVCNRLCCCRPVSMASYLASPTPLNTLFRHPGLLYQVQPGSSSSSSSGSSSSSFVGSSRSSDSGFVGSSSSSSSSSRRSSSSSSSSSHHLQQWTAAEVVLLAAMDAARCAFCWSVLCAAVAAGDVAAAAEAADVLQAALPAGDLAGAAASATAADPATLQVQLLEAAPETADTQQQPQRLAAPLPTAAAAAAGVLASLAGRLGLGATDLISEHSLDGMRFRAFEVKTGRHFEGDNDRQAVQQVSGWPLFQPGTEVASLLVDLAWGFVPSFVRRSNRGLWTLWEGRAARSRRLMRTRRGYVSCEQPQRQ
uniref:Uncharacterized protein n=1 Tax=Tetradesmus obliquus TaxID=3088 RepID=A0A383W6W4_TETOB|eukprot:jgi/Sobl393_1/3330/SZX72446.1